MFFCEVINIFKIKNNNYNIRKCNRRKFKSSKYISNIQSVQDNGIIKLKTEEVCSLIEVKAIDLSLTSNQEKNNFFSCLKSLYQINDLNLKCYKLDEKVNLNQNKINLNDKVYS